MTTSMKFSTPVFSALGIEPTINACGIYTDLGGSRLSPGVWAAMSEANQAFVSLPDLLSASGRHIAHRLNAPAASVTPGAAAAIMLGTAACMAGNDGTRSETLPDTQGMKNRVLIQAGHRYKYDRQVSMTGAELVEVGDANGARSDQFEEHFDGSTAMILHPAHLDGKPGTLDLEQVVALARPHNIPVFVDAAYMVYPIDLMSSYHSRGADLVAVSAKYFGGPNAGGFLHGRQDLIEAVGNVHFTHYESGQYLKYGRPLKMDRQTVVAVVVALNEWLDGDHPARLAKHEALARALELQLSGVSGVVLERKFFTMDERFIDEQANALLLTFPDGTGSRDLSEHLAAETPPIAVILDANRIGIVTDVLEANEVAYIGDRIIHHLGNA